VAAIGWVLIGSFIGAAARLVVPGRRPTDLLMTIVLGLIGAVSGGLIASAIWTIPEGRTPPPAEQAPCAMTPPENLWRLIVSAIWPNSEGASDISQMWPGLLMSVTCAVLVLLAYFALAGRRTTPPDRN
jgi:uncharacterized membrane protein YeaQ/YmgE (transglycosylase-associated protein family)